MGPMLPRYLPPPHRRPEFLTQINETGHPPGQFLQSLLQRPPPGRMKLPEGECVWWYGGPGRGTRSRTDRARSFMPAPHRRCAMRLTRFVVGTIVILCACLTAPLVLADSPAGKKTLDLRIVDGH